MCDHHFDYRITLDNEYEADDPITEKLAIYTFAHVRNWLIEHSPFI